MDSDNLEEVVSFDEMTKICRYNNWIIDYSGYESNIYKKGYISNIEKYNIERRNKKKK